MAGLTLGPVPGGEAGAGLTAIFRSDNRMSVLRHRVFTKTPNGPINTQLSCWFNHSQRHCLALLKPRESEVLEAIVNKYFTAFSQRRFPGVSSLECLKETRQKIS